MNRCPFWAHPHCSCNTAARARFWLAVECSKLVRPLNEEKKGGHSYMCVCHNIHNFSCSLHFNPTSYFTLWVLLFIVHFTPFTTRLIMYKCWFQSSTVTLFYVIFFFLPYPDNYFCVALSCFTPQYWRNKVTYFPNTKLFNITVFEWFFSIWINSIYTFNFKIYTHTKGHIRIRLKASYSWKQFSI